jgi:arylsulfatase
VKDYEGFTGKIGRTVAESEAAWPPNKHPGEKAPNVVVMLFDDLGFSHLGMLWLDNRYSQY